MTTLLSHAFYLLITQELTLNHAVGLPRCVPNEGMTIGDRVFTKGTILSVNPWVIHRSTEIWGHDARSFVPERWFRGDAAELEKKYFIPVSLQTPMLCHRTIRELTDGSRLEVRGRL